MYSCENTGIWKWYWFHGRKQKCVKSLWLLPCSYFPVELWEISFFFHLIVSKFEHKPRNRIVSIISCLKIKYLHQKFFDIRQYYICTLILIWNLSFGMWCTCVVKINSWYWMVVTSQERQISSRFWKSQAKSEISSEVKTTYLLRWVKNFIKANLECGLNVTRVSWDEGNHDIFVTWWDTWYSKLGNGENLPRWN